MRAIGASERRRIGEHTGEKAEIEETTDGCTVSAGEPEFHGLKWLSYRFRCYPDLGHVVGGVWRKNPATSPDQPV